MKGGGSCALRRCLQSSSARGVRSKYEQRDCLAVKTNNGWLAGWLQLAGWLAGWGDPGAFT